MKKGIILCSMLFFIAAQSQQSGMVINNYSIYDYYGNIDATGNTSCYPNVITNNPQSIFVASGSTYTLSNYAALGIGNSTATYIVTSSATNPGVVRPYDFVGLLPTSVIGSNTNWRHSKFFMNYAGTNNPVYGWQANIADGTNICYTWPSYISNSFGEAEWFTISSGSGNVSFLQIY